MILTDAINLVLAEYPGMKAIGAAESADAWIIGLDFASSTDDHPVPGTPSVAVEKTSGVLHDLIPGTEDLWHYMTMSEIGSARIRRQAIQRKKQEEKDTKKHAGPSHTRG